MMAAQAVGIDPYLAAEAGEGARAAINHLRKAQAAKYRAAKAGHIKDAQAELKHISAAKHPKLVNAIQAKLLAAQGRGGDTEIAHLTPGEVVVPRSMQTPELMQQIATLAAQRGLDPAQLSVGHRANKRNPKTGQREFLEEVTVIGTVDKFIPDWLSPGQMRPRIDSSMWGGESGDDDSGQWNEYDALFERLNQIIDNLADAANDDLTKALQTAQMAVRNYRNLQAAANASGTKVTTTVNGKKVNFYESVADENQKKAEKISDEIRKRVVEGKWAGPIPQLEIETVRVVANQVNNFDPGLFNYVNTGVQDAGFPRFLLDPLCNRFNGRDSGMQCCQAKGPRVDVQNHAAAPSQDVLDGMTANELRRARDLYNQAAILTRNSSVLMDTIPMLRALRVFNGIRDIMIDLELKFSTIEGIDIPSHLESIANVYDQEYSTREASCGLGNA